ncbi:MAG: CapA family protein [Actinomycetota bacterium]
MRADGGRCSLPARRALLSAVLVGVAVAIMLGCAGSGPEPGSPRGVLASGIPEPTQGADSVVETPTPNEPDGDPEPFLLTPTPVPTATSTPAPTPTPPPTPTSTPTPLPIVSRTMLFTGDVLSHVPVIDAARRFGDGEGGEWQYDYRPMFDSVRGRVSAADLAICVLETPISPDNTGLAGYPLFNAPTELAAALVDAGYDGCATASNHSIDRGTDGLVATLDEMDRAGLGHAGMHRTEEESLTPQIYDLDGVRIAHLSWTYGLNGLRLPPDKPWMVNVNDVEGIRADAARARTAGADFVVLSIQWGNEYQRTPSAQQLELAPALTEPGDDGGAVDLIIGNHAHVVQPIDLVNERVVVYGLGNSLSNQFDNANRTGTQDGVMIEITIHGNTERGFRPTKVAWFPTWVDRSTYTIVDIADVEDTLEDGTPLPAELDASARRTNEALTLLGFGAEPLDS